jgi:tetratricopeptide (TPR) repeat protein
VAAAFMLFTRAACAEDAVLAEAEGRRLYAEGRARFAAGDYAGAVADFRRAYELVPANALLYNVAQALRLSGQCAEAARTYREFVEHEQPGRLREFAEQRLGELGECAEPVSAEPADPAVTPEPRARPPAPARAPGQRRAAILRQRTPERAPRESGTRATGAALSFGSAAVLLSLSGYFAWRSDQASQRVTRAFDRGERWDGAVVTSEREGVRDQTIAWTTLAGGVLSAGIGTWLVVFD